MIKVIILDIDGVLIGGRNGFNSPDPHPAVIEKLKDLHRSGLVISLSTAKPHFAIYSLITELQLDNPHITDGGAVVINPIREQVVSINGIDAGTAKEFISLCLENNVYMEFYSTKNYFVQRSQVSEITEEHGRIHQNQPVIVDSLVNASEINEVTKIEAIARDERQQAEVDDLFESFKDRLDLSWGVHPVALPMQFGIVTAAGVSKGTGALQVSEALGVPFENILGIADSTSDWKFLKLCKYAAAMGNASDTLKNLVMTKGKDSGYVGPSVDENGVIDILDHFLNSSK